MSNPKFYPRWIERKDGARLIVKTHVEHSSHMGEEFDEDANPVVKPAVQAPVIQMPNPMTPAMEPPDGDDFPEPFCPPAAETLPGEGAESQGQEVAAISQSDRPDAAGISTQSSGQEQVADRVEGGVPDVPFDLDTPIDLDPLGIFEPAADGPAGAAPKRTRKKKAENGA